MVQELRKVRASRFQDLGPTLRGPKLLPILFEEFFSAGIVKFTPKP